MRSGSDTETISFNPKTIGAILSIVVVFVSLILWVGSVYATGEQNTSQLSHQEKEIELLKSQLSEMKIQLNVIQEQNKQLRTSLEEVKSDVKELKSAHYGGN
jgi:cell shape-determining protein MreC